ncbi:uncharacterized protein LOC131313382 isoform X2 [Rhododendron vialii]|uniref:uncharacterized protein LOC131313382 isoform X2 n=1 Tax=Rhododendron vialii TaxID=182163 RepID=UPI00265E58FE|nr:uncharacterized protein LOC131313382 isoform X2 [Rhododendron vialii]
MRRWTAFQGEPKPTPNPATTEDPTNSSLRCGKWLLRSTKIRRSRGDKPSEGKPPGSQPLKRKRSSPSPTSSANSCTGENNVQLPTPMSSSTHPWHNEDEAVSSDDDELLDLEFLDLMEEEKIKMPQRTCELTGQVYTNFLLERHPQTIKDVLRVDAYTFRGLVAELVARGQLQWDHKRVCLEESLAIFLYICGHSQRHRVAADRFQRSTSTISDHFKWMRRALCNLAPHIIQPPNLDVTPPEILNDGRYYPWFQDCVGAIDGTHIEAWVPRHRQVAYRGRKSTITQNVMAACSFDMKFTFVLPGWEGSAHDGRVFQSAVTTPGYNFPHPPLRMRGKKFYVVFVGRNPGIYDSWAACSDQVIRFPGAVHNKFASWDEAYNAWLAYTGQVEQIVPPPVLPFLDDAAGSSSEYTPPGRVSFPLWLILAMTFCFIVVVATVIFYLF